MRQQRKAETPPTMVERVLAVLDSFGPGHSELTLSEISQHTGLPLSTTLRILTQLTEWGALVRSTGRAYRIGPRLAGLAMLA